jgi:ribose transport system substrate-binding protein
MTTMTPQDRPTPQTRQRDVAAEGGSSDDPVAVAKEIVAELSERPTDLGFSTPIDADIPEGKTVYFVTCGAPICEAEAPIIEEATDILGWELTVLSTDGSPQQLQNAWDQIVREKPDVALYTGTPRSVIATQMEQAAENGTFVSGCCHTDAMGEGGLGYVISTPEQVGSLGRIMAAWVVADADEQGLEPGVVYLDLPDFTILSALATEFESNFTELCPDCKYEKMEIGLADLATASDRVVSFLRANTDVKYVVMSADSAFALPAALSAAGLDDVRLFGEGPGFSNQADIVAGDAGCVMIFQAYEIMFAMVDAAARHGGVEAGVVHAAGMDPDEGQHRGSGGTPAAVETWSRSSRSSGARRSASSARRRRAAGYLTRPARRCVSHLARLRLAPFRAKFARAFARDGAVPPWRRASAPLDVVVELLAHLGELQLDDALDVGLHQRSPAGGGQTRWRGRAGGGPPRMPWVATLSWPRCDG